MPTRATTFRLGEVMALVAMVAVVCAVARGNLGISLVLGAILGLSWHRVRALEGQGTDPQFIPFRQRVRWWLGSILCAVFVLYIAALAGEFTAGVIWMLLWVTLILLVGPDPSASGSELDTWIGMGLLMPVLTACGAVVGLLVLRRLMRGLWPGPNGRIRLFYARPQIVLWPDETTAAADPPHGPTGRARISQIDRESAPPVDGF